MNQRAAPKATIFESFSANSWQWGECHRRSGIAIVYASGFWEYDPSDENLPQEATKIAKPDLPETLLRTVLTALDHARREATNIC